MLANLRCLVENITFEVCVATSSLYTTMVTAVASRYVYLKFLITSFVIIRSCLSNVMTSLCIFLQLIFRESIAINTRRLIRYLSALYLNVGRLP